MSCFGKLLRSAGLNGMFRPTGYAVVTSLQIKKSCTCILKLSLLPRYMVRMDERGDAEGNYTLIGRQEHHSTPAEFGLYHVGGFRYTEDDLKGLPVRLILD